MLCFSLVFNMSTIGCSLFTLSLSLLVSLVLPGFCLFVCLFVFIFIYLFFFLFIYFFLFIFFFFFFVFCFCSQIFTLELNVRSSNIGRTYIVSMVM